MVFWGAPIDHKAYIDSTFGAEDRLVLRPFNKKQRVIHKLPVEILLQIFELCEHGIKGALTLSHICRHWRAIALNTASLWNKLTINSHSHMKEISFINMVRMLELQLDRTAEFPLDVVWHRSPSTYHDTIVLNLLRNKGHFSRWRNLAIRFAWGRREKEPVLHQTDVFTNLESLLVESPHYNNIVQTIDRTVTSNFHMLNLSKSQQRADTIPDIYPNILGHTRHLVFARDQVDGGATLLLPKTVAVLEAAQRRGHGFPHITTYKLTRCIFSTDSEIDLRRLTTLLVDTQVTLSMDVNVELPSLREFSFGSISTLPGARFSSPVLEALHIRATANTRQNSARIESIHASLLSPGLHISPQRSLKVELCFPLEDLVRLVWLSPNLEFLFLSFDNEGVLLSVLEAIRQMMTRNEQPCSRLVQLGLRLLWAGDDMDSWRERVEKIMDQCSGGQRALRICVSRDNWDDNTLFNH